MSADPKPASADEIDALILSSFSRGRSRKTVAVIGRVAFALEYQLRAVPDGTIFDRVQFLANSGRLQALGDISKWRRSEVRPVGRFDRQSDIMAWVFDLDKKFPIEEVIDRVRSRREAADAEEKEFLTTSLILRLEDAGQYNEALELIDGEIEQWPDDVGSLISKALLYHHGLDDAEQALVWIDCALERAFHSRVFLREALGWKARILLALGRGDELGQVLEQIMSADLYSNIRDCGKQRDFVEDAPPGLIREDILARYNAFCPNEKRRDELDDWVDEQRPHSSIDEIIERVRSRLQDANDQDWSILANRLQDLLVNRERYEEALRVLDDMLARDPDSSTFAIFKARIYHDYLGETAKGLESINEALERAFRSRHYRRAALGDKARMLLALRRGEELGQVLEQIMSLQMFHDAHDTPRERDFVDDAPPGFIAADIVASYNEYCPRAE